MSFIIGYNKHFVEQVYFANTINTKGICNESS
jgi:hypothetical protein